MKSSTGISFFSPAIYNGGVRHTTSDRKYGLVVDQARLRSQINWISFLSLAAIVATCMMGSRLPAGKALVLRMSQWSDKTRGACVVTLLGLYTLGLLLAEKILRKRALSAAYHNCLLAEGMGGILALHPHIKTTKDEVARYNSSFPPLGRIEERL